MCYNLETGKSIDVVENRTLKKTRKKTFPDDAKACHYPPLLNNHEDLTEQQQEILDNVYDASPQLKEAHELKEAFRDMFEHEYTVAEGKRELQRWLDNAAQANFFRRLSRRSQIGLTRL